MAKLNATRYALLGMLSLKPGSGYDIKKRMSVSTNHFWSESDGAIYPILKKLLDEDMVTCEVENLESGKPKKIYTLTVDGQAELQDWLSKAPQTTPGRDELLLKLFFGANVDKKHMLEHVDQRHQQAERELEVYRDIENYLTSQPNKVKTIYQLVTLKAGIHHTQATIAWCQEVKEIIDAI